MQIRLFPLKFRRFWWPSPEFVNTSHAKIGSDIKPSRTTVRCNKPVMPTKGIRTRMTHHSTTKRSISKASSRATETLAHNDRDNDQRTNFGTSERTLERAIERCTNNERRTNFELSERRTNERTNGLPGNMHSSLCNATRLIRFPACVRA